MRKESAIILILLNFKTIECFEPFSATVFGAIAVSYGAVYAWLKYNPERCNSKWIDSELFGLNYDLDINVHGQHLVKGTVTKLIRQHMRNENPEKALVLSFHGWTGGGKNFVSEIVAKNIYKKYKHLGKSDFVHHFLCTHFHTNDKQLIRNWIKNNITETVKKCRKSLFIFDEIDKLAEGIIDVIKPFIDFNQFVDSVDYRKAIFILLSNTGGTAIAQKTYTFYKSGKLRTDITWKDMEPLIDSGAFNENGGLRKSDIVSKGLIDAYIPFLPLEKKHVKQCIVDYLKEHYNKSNPHQDPGEEFIRDVSDQMEYSPADTQIYSKTGCKRVGPKVDVFI